MPRKEILKNNISHKNVLTIKEASLWASKHLNKKVSESNISYLIQYGKVRKISDNGTLFVLKDDLKAYYESFRGRRELNWKKQLGGDLNWTLSFDHLREKDTTKHVHRLHPYKGKFIPQLVEYFLDEHTDDFKKEKYFNKGDIILDPFCGSGTALVQASELGMHSVGIDVSAFNALISNAKIRKYNYSDLNKEIRKITDDLTGYSNKTNIPSFEQELLDELYVFNNKYFPTPDFRYKVTQKTIDEFHFGNQREKEFLPIYKKLVTKYKIKLKQNNSESFLDKWYMQSTREEIQHIFALIRKIKSRDIKIILGIILSRSIRSCRATTHSDLATLKEPQLTSYYCVKHKKICKPLFSIRSKWTTYSEDTLRRLREYDVSRTDTYQRCLTGDARTIDIFKELHKKNQFFGTLAKKNKINGIFTSPPYVGLIDYHEQHAYAYELFGFTRRDKLEIGPLSKGSGAEARESYVLDIAAVLNNCKKYLVNDYHIFIVANDKYNLYPTIAKKAEMKIVNQFKRPVLNRTERGKGAYSEIIFHMKEK